MSLKGWNGLVGFASSPAGHSLRTDISPDSLMGECGGGRKGPGALEAEGVACGAWPMRGWPVPRQEGIPCTCHSLMSLRQNSEHKSRTTILPCVNLSMSEEKGKV